jgi:anti-sigma factor ChrR (cupin superfamily)
MTQEIPTRLVINCETGEREIIPLTAEEIAEREAMAAQALADQAAREAEETAKAEAKASGIAKLLALGLTEAEATALVN